MIKMVLTFSNKFNIPIVLSLLCGLTCTFIGLSDLKFPSYAPWSAQGFYDFIEYFAASFILIGLISKYARRSEAFSFLFVLVGISLAVAAVWSLLATLFFFLSSFIFGVWIIDKVKLGISSPVISTLLGGGIYATAVSIAAHLPINFPGLYFVFLAIPIIFNWSSVIQHLKAFLHFINHRSYSNVNLLNVLIASISSIYFVVALMPEVGYDALVSHLFVPAQLFLRHKWDFDVVNYVWAVMPMSADWIFSISYMLGGETSARLTNVGFIFILGFLIKDIVLWAGATLIGARVAVLIFLSSPLTFVEGSTLQTESIWASFLIAGTFVALRACHSLGASRLEILLASVLLGVALTTKTITLTLLLPLLIIFIWHYKSLIKTAGLKILCLGAGLFIFFGMIPYLTAWIITSSPIFPLYNKFFKSQYFVTDSNFSNPAFNSGSTWDLIYRITFETNRYLEASAGASGFHWILLIVPALIIGFASLRSRFFSLFLIGLVTFMITFHFQSYLRYVFPSSIIFVTIIGLAINSEFLRTKIVKSIWIFAISCTIILNLYFINSGSQYRDFPLHSILNNTERYNYLQSRLPIRNAVELVNILNIDTSPVAVFADPLVAGLKSVALYPNWYNFVFETEIATMRNEQDLVNILSKRNVKFILLEKNWNGNNCCHSGPYKQAIIEKITEKIAEFGSIQVRRVYPDLKIKFPSVGDEDLIGDSLLINSDFKSLDNWAYTPLKYNKSTGVVLVNNVSPITQKVKIIPGKNYLNSVIARCSESPSKGRIQINWLDNKGVTVESSIRVFDCKSNWTNYSMQVVAPSNSFAAEVYLIGHSSNPLEFKKNSLVEQPLPF